MRPSLAWWASVLLASCGSPNDFVLTGDDSEPTREILKTYVSPNGRRAELDYVSGGGAAGFVFYELDAVTPSGRFAIARVRCRPDVTWVGDIGLSLRCCFDAYDRGNLARDLAAAMLDGFLATYQLPAGCVAR